MSENKCGLEKTYLEMPQEYKTKWLEALRSGEYKQGHQHLCTFDPGEYESRTPVGFCCLGVLTDVISGREALVTGRTSGDGELPDMRWYDEHGMSSFYKTHDDIRHRAGSPLTGERADSLLWTKNDGYSDNAGQRIPPKSFAEIADFIEANVKGV